jgi:hypothetical protein
MCIYIHSVDTSGVNRLASQICHNRFFSQEITTKPSAHDIDRGLILNNA